MAGCSSHMWKEWVPLSNLTDSLPYQFQRGLSTSDLELTCIAAFPDHLVMGTNVGLIYLAHLPSLNLMRLRCENTVMSISTVAVVSTIDDMIATGAIDGCITIFQLPRASVPPKYLMASQERDFFKTGTTKYPKPSVKRFCICNIHQQPITCLTWSKNGMRLFSGDADGSVGMIEVNYQTSECTGRQLLSEPSKIVQLSYAHQLLAVSTEERTLIYKMNDATIIQVGSKPRNQPGLYGCVWFSAPSQPQKSVLYTARPGLRVWSSNSNGVVHYTLKIVEIPAVVEIPLLNPSIGEPKNIDKESFGYLHLIGSSCLVTHSKKWLFAIDTETKQVLGFTGKFRHITDVAVCGNNIFVLEGKRSLVCISKTKPNIGSKCSNSRNTSMNNSTPQTTNSQLHEIGSKIFNQGSNFFGGIAKIGETVASRMSDQTNVIVPGINTGEVLETKNSEINSTRHSDSVYEYSTSESHSNNDDMNNNESFPPRMVQSFSNYIGLPSFLINESPKTGRKETFHPVDIIQSNLGPEVVEEFEEVVNRAQIVANDSDDEPLVQRKKVKKKKKKYDISSSPDSLSVGSVKSTTSDSSNLQHESSCELELGSNVVLHQPVTKEGGKKIGRYTPISTDVDNVEDVHIYGGTSSSPSYTVEDPILNSDNRTSEELKTTTQENESLLAERLGLCCLKMDHERVVNNDFEIVPHNTDITDSNDLNLNLRKSISTERETSIESTSCSTPSTLKDRSPLWDDGFSSDYAKTIIQRSYSIESDHSIENVVTDNIRKKNDTDVDNGSIDNNSDCDSRINSNLSEDRFSNLSYGPPSGSSLPSQGHRSLGEMNEFYVPNKSAIYVLPNGAVASDPQNHVWPIPENEDFLPSSLSLNHYNGNSCNVDNVEGKLFGTERLTDSWVKLNLPSNVLNICSCKDFILFLSQENILYFSNSSPLGKSWSVLKKSNRITDIAVSPNGKRVCLLSGRELFIIVGLDKDNLQLGLTYLHKPIASEIHQVCVDDKVVWYVKQNKVCAQILKQNSSSHIAEVDVTSEDFVITKISCYSGVTWGLTFDGKIVYRSGICVEAPLGYSWELLGEHSVPIRDVHLGQGGLGWMTDAERHVFLLPGVCQISPCGVGGPWYKVNTFEKELISNARNREPFILITISNSLWLTDTIHPHVQLLPFSHLSANRWTRFGDDSWSIVCAEGLYERHGVICCLNPDGSMFIINARTSSIIPLKFSEEQCIVSFSQRPEALWVLTSQGTVYGRTGLSATSYHGTSWEPIDLSPINNVHLCHISLGMEVAWMVDITGRIYLRQGSLSPSLIGAPKPIWRTIDGMPLKDEANFTKVYIGNCYDIVWAVDSNRRIYARIAIYPEILQGYYWEFIPDLEAVQITISETRVFVLTPHGQVYERLGVSSTNYIGDLWVMITENISKLSVSVDNKLWGLNLSGQMVKFECWSYNKDDDKVCDNSRRSISSSSEPDDWEVI